MMMMMLMAANIYSFVEHLLYIREWVRPFLQCCEHRLVAITVSVLVFYYYITSYHKLNGLMQHIFIILVYVHEESEDSSWVFCLNSHRTTVKIHSELDSHLETQPGETCSPRSCDCCTESFILCWLLARGYPQLPEATLSSLPCWTSWPPTFSQPSLEREKNPERRMLNLA